MTDKNERGGGLRHNSGKLRVDLVPEQITRSIANVLMEGLKKYPERNWESGMKWRTVQASLERHWLDWKSGMDFDPDDNQSLIDKVLTNAAILKFYEKLYPEGDDRRHSYLQPRNIALDIDDVLVDWTGHYCARYNLPRPTSWSFDRKLKERFENELLKDKDFWTTIPVKTKPEDIPFEPVCYISARSIPKEWTEELLDKHGFPAVPVINVGIGESKVQAARDNKIDVFVDDNYRNFVDLNNAGILCYLFDVLHNRRYDVGLKRIYSLSELI